MNISQIEKEFDKQFKFNKWIKAGWRFPENSQPNEIKKFYRQKFTELLEETKLEFDKVPASQNDVYDQGLVKGFNFAVRDQQNLIKKALQ